jgi:hypothetical protein
LIRKFNNWKKLNESEEISDILHLKSVIEEYINGDGTIEDMGNDFISFETSHSLGPGNCSFVIFLNKERFSSDIGLNDIDLEIMSDLGILDQKFIESAMCRVRYVDSVDLNPLDNAELEADFKSEHEIRTEKELKDFIYKCQSHDIEKMDPPEDYTRDGLIVTDISVDFPDRY